MGKGRIRTIQQLTCIKILCFIAIIHISFFNSIYGQNNAFRHLTPREGLPTGFIYEIIEDNKGFMWIATNVGLSHYDGYQFINFSSNEDSKHPIEGNAVFDIEQYNDTTLLIASTAGLELIDLRTKKSSLVRIPEHLGVPSTAVDIEISENKEIFLLTDIGVYRFNELPSTNNELDPKFYPEPSSKDDAGSLRGSMEIDNSNNLWISFGRKIGKLDLTLDAIKTYNDFDENIQEILNSNVWDLHVTESGELFISTANGLLRWQKNQDQPSIVSNIGNLNQERLQAASFQSITEDKEGNLIIGTGTEGLLVWNLNTDTLLQYNNIQDNINSIHSDDVHYAFVDSKDITWLGYHFEGISAMYSNTFNYKFEQIEDSLSANDTINLITNVYEDPSGTRWFTTANALIRSTGNKNLQRFTIENDNGTHTYFANVHPLDDDHLFLVTDSLKSYYSFNKNNYKFKKLSPDHVPKGLDFMLNETENSFMFGSGQGQLIFIDKETYLPSTIDVPYPIEYKLPIKPVLAFNNSEGILDVFAIKLTASGPEFKIYNYNISENTFTELPLERESSIGFGLPVQAPKVEGLYYIRVDNGILKLNTITGEADLLFSEDAGVLSQTGRTGQIVIDNTGYLWMATSLTMLRLDPFSETVSYFDLDQNRKPKEVFLGTQLRSGNILFTGNGGYIEFDPDELVYQDNVFDIHITEVNSGELKISPLYDSDAIEFNQSENSLSFSYLALNYKDPTFTKYRYRINGYNDGWVNVGTQQQVYIANIPPGNYTFEVQASPRFGSFSNKSASIDFKIPPPWWKTWPAYVLYGIILISSLVIFDRVQRQRVIAKERERTREKELKQAKEIEIAYENLKATQTKLIQSEKMASLGELTAGIAHEIQNPLNFVNNFSEVSTELIDEANDELDEGDLKEVKVLLKDIKANLEKINHHGKRADSIVKGMLQHSRDHGGERDQIDINQLADEYLRLAYHGFRAKDKSFNAQLKTNFKNSLKKVGVVPQDIGRVILNVITNAFQAVTEKKLQLNGDKAVDFQPTVWVTTYDKDEDIILEVKDNGNGIPERVRNKIFQPFFTTKPAGQGTGLGLSISYDIIKAHGGDIEVISDQEKGTTFKISLPNKT